MTKELMQLNHSQRNFLLFCLNKLNQDDPFLIEEAVKFQETAEAFISSEQMKP